jgi:hypothetical protein
VLLANAVADDVRVVDLRGARSEVSGHRAVARGGQLDRSPDGLDLDRPLDEVDDPDALERAGVLVALLARHADLVAVERLALLAQDRGDVHGRAAGLGEQQELRRSGPGVTLGIVKHDDVTRPGGADEAEALPVKSNACGLRVHQCLQFGPGTGVSGR